mmetsp:Transcript_17703/g.27764  ORF Transcript_17703/g.27764 Transcript_17703/m.27764 type:complete len:689 (+) Transcript_17703:90-2156(+)|eukprot:CAMPEP_0201714718 /NCGR_PEP_ID=MMETSP0593-20130828/1072_1 /ASSEMBLY_ACC=CAM_ASM_000672 /TAXON_ID=267983 /ORGANISM="Skeletonema japonicum, Strain CCMP2506" /LENGTH=688 /DNA_ID=CAMNT_0048204021 /DNA_START=78 /DNA_END=2144 /DNA_ORIENTATION=-
MSEAEANEAVAADANETIVGDNVAAPPVPPAAEVEAAGGGSGAGGLVDNTAFDLSPYFNTLIDTLHRSNDAVQNSVAAAAAGGTNNNNNNALQLRSILVSLLWNGAEQIATAAQANFGQQLQGLEAAFAVDIIGGQSDYDNAAAATTASFFPPKFAAVYLYAVAQNIVALEEIVRLEASLSSQGLVSMDVADGGISIKQVVEIVRAASIAAICCSSRDMISKTGILPALVHLIESTGSRSSLAQLIAITEGSTVDRGPHSLTPFHPEFLQISLLAGQYRFAQSFLQSHPVRNMTLDFPHNFRLHPTMYLRYHYYAGLVHIGCDDWNSSLDSFYLCMTIPCQAVSAISIAARKKSLLVECILLEAEDLDKHSGGDGKMSGRRIAIENRVLGVPSAASQVLARYMAKSSNRVGGGDDDVYGESILAATLTGAETSEQSSRDRGSTRRRTNRAPSNISSDSGDNGGASGGRKANSYSSQLGRYHELVSTYISGNISHYATLLTEMTGLLRADGNWGLAKRLEGWLVYRAVRQKASVYSVTRMSDLEETLQNTCSSLGLTSGGEIGSRRIEDLLMGMAVCDWEDPLVADPFVAKMDHSTSMVSFQDDDPSNHNAGNEELEKDLAHRLSSCVALAERIRQLDIGLTTTTKYQQHEKKQSMMRKDLQSLAHGQGVADLGQHAMDISSGADFFNS